MKFKIYRTARSLFRRPEWRWHLKAGNHKIIATSGEGYRNYADCLAAMRDVQMTSLDTTVQYKDFAASTPLERSPKQPSA